MSKKVRKPVKYVKDQTTVIKLLMDFLKYLEGEGFYWCSPEDKGIIKEFLEED